jgi:flagellar FliJ protein
MDEVRRVLASLLGERDAMIHQIEQIEAEILEQGRNSSLEVFSATLGAYMDGVKRKKDEILLAIVAKDEEIAEQQEKVSEGFRELKTFEIARDQEMARLKKAEDRAEQEMFDELGIQEHARQDAVTESEYLNMRRS